MSESEKLVGFVVGGMLGCMIPVWGALAILTLRDTAHERTEQEIELRGSTPKRVITLHSRCNLFFWLFMFVFWPMVFFGRRSKADGP